MCLTYVYCSLTGCIWCVWLVTHWPPGLHGTCGPGLSCCVLSRPACCAVLWGRSLYPSVSAPHWSIRTSISRMSSKEKISLHERERHAPPALQTPPAEEEEEEPGAETRASAQPSASSKAASSSSSSEEESESESDTESGD